MDSEELFHKFSLYLYLYTNRKNILEQFQFKETVLTDIFKNLTFAQSLPTKHRLPGSLPVLNPSLNLDSPLGSCTPRTRVSEHSHAYTFESNASEGGGMQSEGEGSFNSIT